MTTAERHAALRAALIDAAERAVVRDGLAGLKAREIAREVGCAVGAIYTIFTDLDALALAVNARTLAAIDAALGAATDAQPAAPDPAAQFAELAGAYLDYAANNRPRWDALFAHRMADGRGAPDWFRDQQTELFRYLETPLAMLRPDLPAAAVAALARTLFSAVHGAVSLGLDQKLGSVPPDALRAQTRALAAILADGVARRSDAPADPPQRRGSPRSRG
jgi:AcrR family transcriptional regulator